MAYKLDDLSVTATAADVGDDDDFVPNFVRSQSKNLGRPLAQVIQNSAPESKRRQPRSRTQSSRLASREVLSPTLSSVSTPVDDFHCRQAIQNFRHKIAGEEALKHRKDDCWEWYQQYLETLKSGAWELVILPVVDGLSPDIPEDDPRSVLIFYRILAKVAEYFDQRKALTLVQMVQELKREKLIKQNCEMNAAIQMVFQMTGWLTTLWDPVLDTSTTHLSLRNTRRGARRPIALHCPTVTQRQLEIGESHTPFYRLLTRFGTLLPEPKIIFPDASRGDLEAGPETIDVSYLAFHHLKHDLKVRLEWTSTMNQHLELDSGSGVLYIYRFPSICRLMYHDRTGTIASRVYREYSEVFEKEASPRVRNMLEETEIEDFYAEILLSYDLIFGRHRRSRMLARKKLSDEAEIRHAEGLDDPLLEILCTKPTSSSQVSTIHRELDAENWEDYIELEKFPFLGERLINLQRRSMSRKTHSWRQLWNDNRNIGNWFIIWSVMFFGVCTIGLGITQLIFQIFQIWPPR